MVLGRDRSRGARARRVAFAALALLALVRCGEREKRVFDAPPLAVEAALPRGETEPRASIDVVFDRPMVRLGGAAPSAEEGRRLLVVEPRVGGHYQWTGTRTLSFVVPGGLPNATAFRARIPAGVTALDGSRLRSEVAWEFTTPRPELVASVPAALDSLARPGDPIVLLFNIAVDPRAVARAASMEGVRRFEASRPDSTLLAGLDGRFWASDPETRVALRVVPALERDRAYVLRLAASLRGREGALGPRAVSEIAFRTHGPPDLVGVAADGAAVLELGFRTPVDADSARAYLGLEPPAKIDNAWTSGTRVYLYGAFGYERSYTVTLRAGAPDLFGQRLAADRTLQVTTGKREPTLQLLPQEAVLLPATARTVAVVTTGMGPVRVRAARFSVRDEIAMRERPEGSERRWKLDRTLAAKGEALTTETLELGEILGRGGMGAVVVEARATPLAGEEEAREWTERAVLRWSDLGVTVKASPENGVAWVTRLGSGKPVPHARVAVLDENARPLWRGRADAVGLVRFPGTRALAREPWQLTLVASASGDTASASLVADWRLEPWRYGIPGFWGGRRVDQRAYLWGDRQLYRPGEVVRVAGLVRRPVGAGLASAGLDSILVTGRDPLGREFVRRTVAVSRAGSFAVEVPMAKQAALGRYWLEAAVGVPDPPRQRRGRPDREVIGSHGFEIAAFRAPAFRSRVVPEVAIHFRGGVVRARVQGSYYFGAPLAGASFTWSAVRERTEFAPRGYEGFSFGDPELDVPYGGMLGRGSGALGDSGSAPLELPLPPEMPAATQAIHLEAVVRDASGDAVAGRASVLYHPAPVYAGVEVSPHFVAPGSPVTVRTVAVRADSASAWAGVPLALEIVRRDHRAVRKLLVGGRVGYETAAVDSVVERLDLVSGASPGESRLTPTGPGTYLVRVQATTAGGASPRAVARFYVAGERPGAWQPTDAARLELVTDKRTYAVGDTARILVTSSVRAERALLTIEREGVGEARLVGLEPGRQVLLVPVRAAHAPGVYVGLASVERALTSTEAPGLPEPARLPRFAAGYATLTVDVESRRLAVRVRPEKEEYAPGDRARIAIDVQASDGAPVPSELAIAVVDEAVLALLGQRLPEPFEFFYAPRPLAVANSDTRLRLSAGSRLEAAQFKGEPGGDGAEKLAARTLFTTTAYWNPSVATNARGAASIEFALPDNLTRFRVVAVAASGSDRFGTGLGSFRVTRALVLEPALPRFAVAGDTVELAAVVTNRSPRPSRGAVRLTTDLGLLGPAEHAVEVAGNASIRVGFRARVAAAAGDADVTGKPSDARVRFEARFDPPDAVETRLPVLAPIVPQTAASAAQAREPVRERVAVLEAAIPGSARLELELASSALAGATPAIDWVVDYPYGCLEQRASRLLVLLVAREVLASAAGDSAGLTGRTAQAVRDLEALGSAWGAFSFWPGGEPAEPWMAAYAVWALARARAAGFEVTETLLETSQYSLMRAWREGVARPERRRGTAPGEDPGDRPRTPPYGMILLALSSLVQPAPGSLLGPADVEVAADRVAELPEDEKLLLALAFHAWKRDGDLVGRTLEETLARAHTAGGAATIPAFEAPGRPAPFRTASRLTSLALTLASLVRPQDPTTTRLASGLLGMRAGGHWGHTQDDAWALLALAAYHDRVEKRAGPVAGEVRWTGEAEPLLALAAPAGALVRRTRTVGLPAAGGASLGLDFEPDGLLHYVATLRWDEEAGRRGAEDAGFSITRRVERYEGTGPVRLGDLVVLTLEVVVPRDAWYLAVVEPLPAGLEIVQGEFATESRRVAETLARWSSPYPRLPATHVERGDRELRVFADRVAAGVYAHHAVARVRATGSFVHLPARVEAMYSPGLRGTTPVERFRALGEEKPR